MWLVEFLTFAKICVSSIGCRAHSHLEKLIKFATLRSSTITWMKPYLTWLKSSLSIHVWLRSHQYATFALGFHLSATWQYWNTAHAMHCMPFKKISHFIKKSISKWYSQTLIILAVQGKDIGHKLSSLHWNLEGVELPLDRDSRFLD